MSKGLGARGGSSVVREIPCRRGRSGLHKDTKPHSPSHTTPNPQTQYTYNQRNNTRRIFPEVRTGKPRKYSTAQLRDVSEKIPVLNGAKTQEEIVGQI